MGTYKPTPIEGYSYESWFPDKYQAFFGAVPIVAYAVGIKTRNYRTALLPIVAGVGLAIGGAVSYGIHDIARRRMLMVEDYIDRHPEQFVEPAPLKYKDILRPWHPDR